MKRAGTPTLLEFAGLFDYWRLEDPDLALQHTLRWLIDQSEAARALDNRLRQRQTGQPSLADLGELLLAVQSEPYSPATAVTLHWLIGQLPAVKERNDQLEELVADCGIVKTNPDRLSEAINIEAKLEHWLAVLDEDPEQAVDSRGEHGLEETLYRLLSLCRVRIGRSKGREKRRLEHLRRRLQQSARRSPNPLRDKRGLGELLAPRSDQREDGELLAKVEELVACLQAGTSLQSATQSPPADGAGEEVR